MSVAVKELVDELLQGTLTEAELVEKLRKAAEIEVDEATAPEPFAKIEEIELAAKKAQQL